MNQKLCRVLVSLSVTASLIMFFVGKGSSHLSELYDFFWVPLPLAIVGIIGLVMKKKQ